MDNQKDDNGYAVKVELDECLRIIRAKIQQLKRERVNVKRELGNVERELVNARSEPSITESAN